MVLCDSIGGILKSGLWPKRVIGESGMQWRRLFCGGFFLC